MWPCNTAPPGRRRVPARSPARPGHSSPHNLHAAAHRCDARAEGAYLGLALALVLRQVVHGEADEDEGDGEGFLSLLVLGRNRSRGDIKFPIATVHGDTRFGGACFFAEAFCAGAVDDELLLCCVCNHENFLAGTLR